MAQAPTGSSLSVTPAKASIELLSAVAIASNEAMTVNEALMRALDLVCSHAGFPVGYAFLAADTDEGTTIVTEAGSWYACPTDRGTSPGQAPAEMPPDSSVIDEVLRTHEPHWRSAPDDPVARAAPVDQAAATIALPVMVGDRVAAVLAFASGDQATPLDDLLPILRPLGAQLARVVERARSEAALRESECRFQQAFEREREAVGQLRALDDTKNAILTALSHELRTPLTSVIGFAQMLQQRGDDLTPEEHREFLDRIEYNAVRLERLLSDLLDLDRLKRGIIQPVRRPTEIAEILRSVAEDARTSEARIIVDVTSLVADVDGPKVERIVENLLANAIKYTPKGTRIWLRARGCEGGILLRVEDEGSGVDDDLKDTIFQAFERGPRLPAHTSGTGVGLTLVTRFAELHGGKAWVEDRRGGGASFRVYLPAAVASDPPRLIELPPSNPVTQRT